MYISSLISALATATVSSVPPERGILVAGEATPLLNAEDHDLLRVAAAEVDRYRSMDRLVPSAHNIVTIAALEVSSPIIFMRSRLTEKLVQHGSQLSKFDPE